MFLFLALILSYTLFSVSVSCDAQYALYDLENDPYEINNLYYDSSDEITEVKVRVENSIISLWHNILYWQF